MLLLAHTGITAGCVWLTGKAAPFLRSKKSASGAGKITSRPLPGNPATSIDYRLLFLGSMLPDIIDKPLGLYFLADQLSNGRIYAHTLLFALLLLLSGFALYLAGRNTGGLVLAGGVLAHLVLDGMWDTPHTFLWPLYGFTFDKHPAGDWLPGIFEALTSEPSVYIPEIIGALLLLAFFRQLLRDRRMGEFFKTGHRR